MLSWQPARMQRCFGDATHRCGQVVLLVACFWYLLFAPLTLPLTVYVCWRMTLSPKEVLDDIDHDSLLEHSSCMREERRRSYEVSLVSMLVGSG